MQNDSYLRLLGKGWKPKILKTGAANAGEARKNGKPSAE